MIKRRVTRPPPMYMRLLLPCSGWSATASPSRRSASVPAVRRRRRGSEEEDEEEEDDDDSRDGDADVDVPIAHRSPVEPTAAAHADRTAIHAVNTQSVCQEQLVRDAEWTARRNVSPGEPTPARWTGRSFNARPELAIGCLGAPPR